MASDSFIDLPANFRRETFEKIQKAISRHESITVLAPPGMGKTTTMQLLTKQIPNSVYIDLNSNWQKNISTDKALVIILDHCENLADQLYFKSIRETARDKISFVFAISGSTIPEGPIHHVMLENVIYLEPLNQNDAKEFLNRCELLFSGKLNSAQKSQILKLAGGFPRLIKRLCKLFLDNIDPNSDLKLQNDLKEIEIFLDKNPKLKWNIALLEGKTEALEKIGDIKFTESLSKQEYLLAKLLIENQDKMVTREQMIEAIWQSKMYDINDHALDQMLHRTRTKLSKANPKCRLITYRGRGCKLELL